MDAMILAAGRGQRMGELTANTPKPLLRVADGSLIEHQLRHLSAAGYRRVVINTHYLGEQIHRRLGQGWIFGLEIAYSDEFSIALDTGGGILQALPLLSDPFVVVNGDIWTDYPLEQLSIADTVLAHLVLVANPEHHPRGDFFLHEGRAQPLADQGELSGLTFSGIGCYRKALFRGVDQTVFPLAPLLRRQAESGRVSAESYSGQWYDIGTPERLTCLQREFNKKLVR